MYPLKLTHTSLAHTFMAPIEKPQKKKGQIVILFY